jgi:hypothetical protein
MINQELDTVQNELRHTEGEVLQKSPTIYHCEKCKYTTNKTNDYTKHLITKKHNAEKNDNCEKNKCPNCSKTYSSASNLWKHKQKCNTSKQASLSQTNNFKSQNDIIIELLKQTHVLQNLIIENQKNAIESNRISMQNMLPKP